MPFKTVTELRNSDIDGVDDLSEREARIFKAVFNRMVYDGAEEGDAIAAAFSQARKKGRRSESSSRT